MGGGDLNTKKSWHPNTIKNQERVWKAEQAAAEEKKRILELQRERGQERDREELNSIAKNNAGNMATDDRLHWMYNKPDKKVQEEDYLLGKAIDGNYDKNEKADQDIIPAVARRVVGSSMLTTSEDTQVDLARKMREDPLLLVKERERAARAALLNNPLQRRKLTELLKKEQEQRNEIKEKKKSKKKEKDLDNLLAAKLSALGNKQNLDIATLLADNSSPSSSDREQSKVKKQKKRKKKSKKSKKNKSNSAVVSSDDDMKNIRSEKGTVKSNNTNTIQKLKTTEKVKSTDKEYKKTKQYNSSEESCDERYKHSSRKVQYKRKNESDVGQQKNRRDRSYSRDRNKYKRDKSEGVVDDRKIDRQRSKSTDLSNSDSSTNKNAAKESIKKCARERNISDNANRKVKRRKSNSTERDKQTKDKYRFNHDDRGHRNESRKRSHSEDRLYDSVQRYKNSSKDFSNKIKRRKSKSVDRQESRTKKREQTKGLTEEEKAAKLAEMAAAGAEHERERGKRVAEQRSEAEVSKATYQRTNNEARSLPDSLQSRIHSNRHYIQRNERHMNEHFARR